MMATAISLHDDPRPGELVERFSWEIAAKQASADDTEEYEQLRTDFVKDQEWRREKETLIGSIDAQFERTRHGPPPAYAA